MTKFLIFAALFIAANAWAGMKPDTDGSGQKIQAVAPTSQKFKVIGTKGYACYSTESIVGMYYQLREKNSDGTDSLVEGKVYLINTATGLPDGTKFMLKAHGDLVPGSGYKRMCHDTYSSATIKTSGAWVNK